MTMTSRLLDLKSDYNINWLGVLNDQKNRFVAIDFETNGVDFYKDPQNAETRGFSLSVRIGNHYLSDYFPVSHPDANLAEKDWRPILEAATGQGKCNVVHNYLADSKFSEKLGVSLSDDFIDTMRLAHLDNENFGRTEGGYSLEACCLRYLGEHGKSKSVEFENMLKLVGWAGMPYILIGPYGSHDAQQTLKLAYALMKKTQKEPGLREYWEKVDRPNQQTLKHMREVGIKVDLEFCKMMEEKCFENMRRIESETGRRFQGAGSVKDMQELFWEDLKLPIIYNKRKQKDGTFKETPSLDAKAMERYEAILERDNNPIARKVLEFRGWQKAVTAFYQPYQEHVDSDGRIRTNYKAHGTVTGRYSSSKPNLQQIPKESDKPWNGEVKRAFVPEDGFELWEFDYSQLEFRLAALLTGEQKLLDIFNDDSRDIFTEMSQELGLTRQQCKTLTYSIQYGAGAQRIMDVFGYSKQKALDTIQRWYKNYPNIHKATQRYKAECTRNGKVEIWSGRFRHFMTPAKESHKAFNSANQGGAADIVKISMNKVRQQIPELNMNLQIHDALVFEIPLGQQDFYVPQIKEIMEHPVEQDRVRLKVDGHVLGSK